MNKCFLPDCVQLWVFSVIVVLANSQGEKSKGTFITLIVKRIYWGIN